MVNWQSAGPTSHALFCMKDSKVYGGQADYQVELYYRYNLQSVVVLLRVTLFYLYFSLSTCLLYTCINSGMAGMNQDSVTNQE